MFVVDVHAVWTKIKYVVLVKARLWWPDNLNIRSFATKVLFWLKSVFVCGKQSNYDQKFQMNFAALTFWRIITQMPCWFFSVRLWWICATCLNYSTLNGLLDVVGLLSFYFGLVFSSHISLYFFLLFTVHQGIDDVRC